MVSRDELIAELLSDPLLVEKGYLPEKGVKSDSKMVELIKLVVDSKYNDETDSIITRKINLLLNPSNSNLKQ